MGKNISILIRKIPYIAPLNFNRGKSMPQLDTAWWCLYTSAMPRSNGEGTKWAQSVFTYNYNLAVHHLRGFPFWSHFSIIFLNSKKRCWMNSTDVHPCGIYWALLGVKSNISFLHYTSVPFILTHSFGIFENIENSFKKQFLVKRSWAQLWFLVSTHPGIY